MKKIEEILKEKNVKAEDLPSKLQEAVKNSALHFAEMEEANKSLTEESTDEEKQNAKELEDSVLEFNQEISNVIDDWLDTQKEEVVEEVVEEKKKEEEKQETPAQTAPEKPEQKVVEPTVEAKPIENKKKSGLGAFFIGAAILVITAGAINVMNKK